MYGAYPEINKSTSLTHSLIHFPQEKRSGESPAAFPILPAADGNISRFTWNIEFALSFPGKI